MISVLFVAQFRIDDNKGGVQRVTQTLADEFRKSGIRVNYLALKSGMTEDINGVTQYYIPDSQRLGSRKNVEFLKKLLLAENVSVLINQAGIYPKPLALIAKACNKDVKLISVHHNCIACLNTNYRNILMESYGDSRLLRLVASGVVLSLMKIYNRVKYGRYFREAIRTSHKLVLLSERFKSELIFYTNDLDFSKVVGIPNPAPFECVKDVESKKENRLLFVGRLNFAQKRADLLIDIWKGLQDDYPHWCFDVVGDGPRLQALRESVEANGLKNIFFYGFQDPRPFLERAKLFCMTSAFEGYGMVLVEAQAYGVVPLAFDTFTALHDIIQSGRNGIVIEPFDTNKYVAQLSRLMADDNLRRSLALACQSSVQRHDVALIAEQWFKLFQELQNNE